MRIPRYYLVSDDSADTAIVWDLPDKGRQVDGPYPSVVPAPMIFQRYYGHCAEVIQMITRRDALKLIAGGLSAAAWSESVAASQFPKGAIIRTVLKDLSPDALTGGATLFHEHMSLAADFMPRWIALARSTLPGLFPGSPGAVRGVPPPVPPPQPYFMQNAELMTEEMSAAAKDGVACIVDQGHPDMGRNLDFLKRISTQSGLPIVAGCGYYTQPFYPSEISAWSEDQISRELVRQAKTQPIGVIGEIGTWDLMTLDERKVFRAVAKAHRATNLAVVTHTNLGKGGVEQLDLLESAGVKPARVAIGHVGGLNDAAAEVPKAIAKRGAFVGFDRQGGSGDGMQVKMVMAMLEAGYAENLLFSSDFSLGGRQLKRSGGPGYAKTLTVFVPKLREAGVDEKTLHGILVNNPRRLLAFVRKR
jgi:phosphotriesterase-related protein